MKIITLLKHYQIENDQSLLKQVWRHSSFAEKNHSRFVFLGQFAFKGAVSQWAFQNIGGTGTQLQHYLGNLFSKQRLDFLFDDWQLHFEAKAKADVDLEAQKHLFVYAILGYVCQKSEPMILNNFITNVFLKNSDHLAPNVISPKNDWQQFVFLCKQHREVTPKIKHQITPDKINTFEIWLSDALFEQQSSVGYKYARKKVITKAIKKLCTELETVLLEAETHLHTETLLKEKENKHKAKLKAEKKEIHEQKIASHQTRMKERKIALEKQAREQDGKRREAKQAAKDKNVSRKGSKTIYREYSLEEIKAMSSQKRRNLQDKGIIPKGIKF